MGNKDKSNKKMINNWLLRRSKGQEHVPKLLRLLRKSYSLDRDEKSRIIRELPNLSQFQVDSLIGVFEEENEKWKTLKDQHPRDIKILKKRCDKQWKSIEREIMRRINGEKSIDALPKPEQLLEKLGQKVIGQEKAQEQVVTILYYHALMNGIGLPLEENEEIRREPPHRQPPVLMIGPTGSGKTLLLREAAALLDVNLVIIDASLLVREGIVGTSISDIAVQIQEKAAFDVDRAKTSVVVLDEFDKLLTEDGSHQNRSVLNQLLTMLEGTTPLRVPPHQYKEQKNPKLQMELPTDRMLFLLAGAFESLREAQNKRSMGFIQEPGKGNAIDDEGLSSAGLPAELRGRIGTLINLDPLNVEQLVTILKKAPHSPLVRIQKEMALFDCEVDIDEQLLRQLAEDSLQSGLGARGLYQAFNMLPSVRRLRLIAPRIYKSCTGFQIVSPDEDEGLVALGGTCEEDEEALECEAKCISGF